MLPDTEAQRVLGLAGQKGLLRARRERKAAENGPDGQTAKSAAIRMNPRKHAGTVANRQEKTPTENGWVL